MDTGTFFERFTVFRERVRDNGSLGGAFQTVGSSLGSHVSILVDGDVVQLVTSFMSLDYLGLGQESSVVDTGKRNLECFGTGFASSRTVMESTPHIALERALADFKQGAGCLLVNTGYLGNVVLMHLLLDDIVVVGGYRLRRRKSVVFMDELAHASFHDALLGLSRKLSTLDVKKYDHLNYSMLSDMLETYGDPDILKVIVTDSLFSMSGDFADMRTLVDLAKKHDAILISDNAHSDGVYGLEGRGVLDDPGVFNSEDFKHIIQTGTLSKSFCAVGGHIAFPVESIVELAKFSQWGFIFSVAIPTFLAATCIHTLDLIRGDVGESKRKHLRSLSGNLLHRLREGGFDTLQSSSHIIPIVIGATNKCLEVQSYLVREWSMWLGAIRWPAVSKDGALLRCALNANHTEEDINNLVVALKAARDRFHF